MLREQALSIGKVASSESEVGSYVQAYLERLEKGLQPDLESYLMAEVPADLREPVFREVDRALANEDADEAILPETEVTAVHEGEEVKLPRWLPPLAFLVPGAVRTQMLRAMTEQYREASLLGTPQWKSALGAIRELLEGLAQRAPLRPPPTRETDEVSKAAQYGWIAWRFSGLILLLGYLLSNPWLAALGVVALLAAFGCLVKVTYPDLSRMSAKDTQFMNALLGGAVAALTLVVVFGALCGLLIAAGSVLGWSFLSTIGIHVLVLLATGITCGITLSGWSPEEWYPEWLVRA